MTRVAYLCPFDLGLATTYEDGENPEELILKEVPADQPGTLTEAKWLIKTGCLKTFNPIEFATFLVEEFARRKLDIQHMVRK